MGTAITARRRGITTITGRRTTTVAIIAVDTATMVVTMTAEGAKP